MPMLRITPDKKNTVMGIPIDGGRIICVLIFHSQTCKVLFKTTSTTPQIPRACVASGRINEKKLQEWLKIIMQSELDESAVKKDTVTKGDTEYFFVEGSTLNSKEGYTWKFASEVIRALEDEDADLEVFLTLTGFMPFTLNKIMDLGAIPSNREG
ncbi:hypothetical protein BDW75DRAFT_226413 [Aspergillus navahoensis]